MNYIAMAIPVFLLFVVIELLLDWRKKTGYYRVNDTINSLSTGILSRITAILCYCSTTRTKGIHTVNHTS